MKNIKLLVSLWALVLAGFVGNYDVYAQDEGRITDFARPGRPTMLIYVWGTASTPGIWKVETDVDPVELLTAAQVANYGNVEAANKQTIYLSIFRERGSQRTEIYKAKMDEFLTGEKQAPPLQEGDLLFVETHTKQRFSLQTILSGISAAASIVLLIIRLDQLGN